MVSGCQIIDLSKNITKSLCPVRKPSDYRNPKLKSVRLPNSLLPARTVRRRRRSSPPSADRLRPSLHRLPPLPVARVRAVPASGLRPPRRSSLPALGAPPHRSSAPAFTARPAKPGSAIPRDSAEAPVQHLLGQALVPSRARLGARARARATRPHPGKNQNAPAWSLFDAATSSNQLL